MTWTTALAILLMYLVAQYLDWKINLRPRTLATHVARADEGSSKPPRHSRVQFVKVRHAPIRFGWRISWRR